jgi:hypothetical protein
MKNINDQGYKVTGQNGWSLERTYWEQLSNSLKKLELEWKSLPLKKTLNNLVPKKKGIYLIIGKTPVSIPGEYFDFKTPLYVGISSTNLNSRFQSHCNGELVGVRRLVRTWDIDQLDFVFAEVTVRSEQESLEQLLYDLETEFMIAFGPTANIRAQTPSYLKEESVYN